MLIKLQAEQISKMWDAIAFSLVQTQGVPKEQEAQLLNNALTSLLAGTHQCWMMFDRHADETNIYSITVTSLSKNTLFGYPMLFVESLFGFRKMNKELATEGIEKLKEFAKAHKCLKLVMLTVHPKVKEYAELTGFTEFSSIYVLDL